MSETKSSVLAAVGIVLSVGAVYTGLQARQKADLGSLQTSNSDVSTSRMLASRSNDVNVPASDYFYELTQKLKEQYVEPVTDDQKLASGAIRGMVASLADPDSSYMDKNQFRAFLAARTGKYEGIGADFVLSLNGRRMGSKATGAEGASDLTPDDALVTVQEIPKVKVVCVVPGGPADRAGVQVGDVVDSVDGHWVVNSDVIRKFKIASKLFTNKKLSRAQLEIMRSEIRTKFEKAIFPGKAREKLFMGASGVVNVVWNRNGTLKKTVIARAPSSLPGLTEVNGVIELPLVQSSADFLKNAIKDKAFVTIDLRNNTLGDVQSMKNCLEVIAPKGHYGYFVTQRHDTPTPLTVTNGNAHPPKIKLLTDQSTRGMAEAFAEALSSRGLATLSSGSMGGDTSSRQIIQLPDGSGYTLVTSAYQPKAGTSVVTKRVGAR
ncbi:MAG: PDZ domain-containing protein [Fimbriimonas sp.]|nr:PDZ domain-containing protein [Fimbriimonas sp.]